MSTHSHEATECEVYSVDRAVVGRVLASLPNEVEARAAVAVFDALADPTRLRILQSLALAGELCVCDLAALTAVSSSAVSHQLRLLRDRGLVKSSRQGKRAMYRLADSHVSALLAQGLEHASEMRGTASGK